MKTLQNYKIETNGLTEAILHKAVEEGYKVRVDSARHLSTKYLYLYSSGLIGLSDNDEHFKYHGHPEISAHDFLRLNWTPKVGEEVECVNLVGLIGDGEDNYSEHTIAVGNKYLIASIGYSYSETHLRLIGVRYQHRLANFIPIYPRKKEQSKENKCVTCGNPVRNDVFTVCDNCWDIHHNQHQPIPEQPKEKPDAYIAMGDMPLYPKLIFRDEDMNMNLGGMLDEAYQYNLLSESDYKAKYPDKLMFKNWWVTVGDKSIDVGCKTYLKETLKHFLFICDEIFDQGVEIIEAHRYINDNRKTLGL